MTLDRSVPPLVDEPTGDVIGRRLEESQTQNLCAVVAASCELGAAIAGDGVTAAELAARHLERFLVRGSNARLAAALADLAGEFASLRRTPRRGVYVISEGPS